MHKHTHTNLDPAATENCHSLKLKLPTTELFHCWGLSALLKCSLMEVDGSLGSSFAV